VWRAKNIKKSEEDISDKGSKFKAQIIRTAHLRAKAAKNKEIKLRVPLRCAPLISNTLEFDFSASPFQTDPTKWSVNFALPRQVGSLTTNNLKLLNFFLVRLKIVVNALD